jgi:ankyrin repeat protein
VLAMLATSFGALHSWYSKNTYVKAAMLSEAYPVATEIKSLVSDHFIEFGVLPNSNRDVDLPSADSLFGTSISTVSIVQGGVVEVGFSRKGRLAPGSMIFSPSVSPVTGYLYWRCSSDSIDRKVLRNLRPSCNYTPASLEGDLITAIKNRHLKSVDSLLEQGADPDGFTNGVTPLMVAAGIGDIEILDRLVVADAQIDLKANNHDGLTALMMAIMNRHENVVHSLLASGASTSTKDNHGRIASQHAIGTSNQIDDDRISIILQQADNPQFLSHAAESSATVFTATASASAASTAAASTLPRLARHTSSLGRERLRRNMRMLGDQCLNTSVVILREQIKTSCSMAMSKLLQLSTEKPEIALMTLELAIEELEESVLVENFEKFVISTEQINTNGQMEQTALSKAIALNKPEFATLLIERGANVNAITSKLSRPLIEASKLGNAQLVTHLLLAGAHLDTADSFGTTALLAAVGRGHHTVVDLLIDAGAETNAIDANGIDAYLLAKNRQFISIERLLLAAKGV